MVDNKWLITSLSQLHERESFSSGNDQLDSFLKTLAMQYQKKDFGRTFVLIEARSKIIKAYYTMSSGSVDLSVLPETVRKRLPRHPVPVVHIGRLAVCQSVQGHGIGETMLMDALARSLKLADAELGIFAVEVVAIDEKAVSFYERYGFKPLLDDRHHLYLPLKVLRKLST